ncbi:hypothetical protein EJ03DRAFT_332021 [Teratosphaeria nubilosa]|uniref:VHS domain-containing protein n=1 Tax=Teratosphaeria nubilosa TaxID=161662 RepID=A0A6G1KUD0_9PEZI|nr:hypothetical protein EJ03DRAFT_332021 [Teratosphaeria nubilosa]
MSMFREKKPYTAVTVQIDRLTSEQYEEDDVGGIIDLVDVIRIQDSGPTEAARAIRKKLKYGNPHRQIRALVILDGLIQNAGSRFQRAFADEPLLERLRLMAREEMVDPQVRQKCRVLFVQWANAYKRTPGLERIANLYKEFPKTQRPAAARQKVLREADPFEDDNDSPTSPAAASAHARNPSRDVSATSSAPSRPVSLMPTSSKLSKAKSKFSSGKPFNLSKEKENMTNCIARSSIASTNLLNGLQLINREHQRVSDDPEIAKRFETCKTLRRQILLYIQHVESDDWIGSLVNANDELVKALTAYEIMDRSIDDDSDSDHFEESPVPTTAHGRTVSTDTATQLAGLRMDDPAPVKPPRPAPAGIAIPANRSFKGEDDASEDEGEDNPFGDANAVPLPHAERSGMKWREI